MTGVLLSIADRAVWIGVGLALCGSADRAAWLAAAAAALIVGRSIRNRDRQIPHDD